MHSSLEVARGLAGVLVPAAVYAASRLATWPVAYAMRAIGQSEPVFTGGDARWYLDVARNGYPERAAAVVEGADGPLAHFPGYPVVVRAASALTGWEVETAGVVVSLLCGLAATVAVWALAHQWLDEPRATIAAALFCFSPGAAVFSMAYGDAMFLALAVPALLALLRRQWALAAGLGAAAGFTSPAGVALVVAFAVRATAAASRTSSWRPLVAPALAPVGALAFFAYLHARTGDALAWFASSGDGWADLRPWPLHALREVVADPGADVGAALSVVAVPALVVGFVLLRRMAAPAPLLAYTATLIACVVVTGAWAAGPRVVLLTFPVFIAAARWLPPRYAGGVVATSGAAMLTLLFVAPFTSRFVL